MTGHPHDQDTVPYIKNPDEATQPTSINFGKTVQLWIGPEDAAMIGRMDGGIEVLVPNYDESKSEMVPDNVAFVLACILRAQTDAAFNTEMIEWFNSFIEKNSEE